MPTIFDEAKSIYGTPMFNQGKDRAMANMFFRGTAAGPIDMARYSRPNGNLNVTDAINAGHTIQPWALSTGAGPSSVGYRGSSSIGQSRYHSRYGGSRSGEEKDFRTKRPTARTAQEYYSMRDQVLGNPLTMLRMNGPGRYNLLNSLISETRGSAAPPEASAPMGPNNVQVSGDTSDDDHMMTVMPDGSKQLVSTSGKGSSVSPITAARSNSLPNTGLDAWRGMMGPSKEVLTKEAEGPVNFVGPPRNASVSPIALARMSHKERAAALAKADAEMAEGTFTPGPISGANPFSPGPSIWNMLLGAGRGLRTNLPRILPSGATYR